MIATTTVAELELVENYVENTQYGPYPVRARKVETVVRYDEGRYAGKLELRVAYWRNGQRMPGYSDGNPTAIEAALERAASEARS
jgi:hypothetical protein